MQNELKNIWNIFRFTFGIVPIIAGLDKFTNLLVHWDKYLSPGLLSMLPVSTSIFFSVIGVIEISAGLIVLKYTKAGSLIVMGWLISLAIVLIIGGYYDIAIRDLVMAVSSYGLFRLTLLEELEA